MTFSIVGHCVETGMLGVAIATSSICVGARCPHARAGTGAVASQNITNPALGPALLHRLQNGQPAQAALDGLLADIDHAEYRQLLVIDAAGQTACHTGTNILGVHGESKGRHCHAAGNLLDNAGVPGAMTGKFEALRGVHLARRLLACVRAGLDAGGERGSVHSAALLVVHTESFALVDLRADWDEHCPVARLEQLWERYEPQMPDYLLRALNPAEAPGYGVPGDP